jgi:hypothetical protein
MEIGKKYSSQAFVRIFGGNEDRKEIFSASVRGNLCGNEDKKEIFSASVLAGKKFRGREEELFPVAIHICHTPILTLWCGDEG